MKCKDCKKRIWKNWQPWCSAGLENDTQLYDYHKKCFRKHHYKEWIWFNPEKKVVIFNNQKVPESGWYTLVGHTKECESLPAEQLMFFAKGDIASALIMCEHDVKWELVAPYD